MGDYEKLNSMDRRELLDFAMFAYTAYPTLLETHGIRQAFFKKYPDKNPYRKPTDAHQMELPLE